MAEKDYSNNTQKLTDIYRVIVWKINWTGTGQQQQQRQQQIHKYLNNCLTPGLVLEKCLRRSHRMLEI